MINNRYPLLGLEQGMILAIGRIFGPRGAWDFPMLLDTGSSITVIAPEILSQVGLDRTAVVEERIIYTHGGASKSPILIVPRFRAFGQEVRNLRIACEELPPQVRVKGALGLNFLSHFDLRLNFCERYIELR